MKLVEPPSCSSASTIVFIGRNRRGQWVAQEQNGLYGGLFVNRAQALKYALFENGHHPETIVELARDIELDMARDGLLGRCARPTRRLTEATDSLRESKRSASSRSRPRIPMTSISTPAIWLAGYIPDIPTPFDDHGALDLAAFAGFASARSVPASAPFWSARPAAKPRR